MNKQPGFQTATMVLSEARGLVLSWVIRGGKGLVLRLRAFQRSRTADWLLSLEPDHLQSRAPADQMNFPGMQRSETLSYL